MLGLDNIDAKSSSNGQINIHPGQSKRFVSIDVTSAVREWNVGHQNYGLLIWTTNENIAGRDTIVLVNLRMIHPNTPTLKSTVVVLLAQWEIQEVIVTLWKHLFLLKENKQTV